MYPSIAERLAPAIVSAVNVTLPKTMRAVVYRGVDDLRVEELPVPRIRAGELLVRVEACGVCPTDIKKIHYGTVPPPRIFGHETSGVIVRVGARVTGFQVGDRVALHHHVPCLKCHACRHFAYAQCAGYKKTGITAGFEPAGGGYAEYVRVMNFVLPGVVKIPRRNSMLEGAMLEPVNTVLKAVRRLKVLPGDAALVIGQGPIGLMFNQLLRLEGVRVVGSDLLDARLAQSRRFGAWAGWRADAPDFEAKLDQFTRGRGLDVVVVATPSDAAVQQSFKWLRGAGQILLFAHTKRGESCGLDLASVCMDEKDLIGSYSSDVRLQGEVARLVFRRALDVRKMVTHVYPLEETAIAVDLARRSLPEALKVVVSPTGLSDATAIGK